MTTPQVGPIVVDLETMGAQAGEQEPPKPVDLTTVRLEGDNVPEELRGKTAAELIDFNRRLTDALRISEISRQQAPTAVAPIAPEPVLPPKMDPEELRQMFIDDPVGAFNKMQEEWTTKAEAHLAARLQPLVSGAAAGAESNARSKYPDEFTLFENDIKAIVNGMPAQQRSALSNPAAWDDLISYVRGRPGNFEKVIDARTTKAMKDARKIGAQAAQELETGLTFTDAPRRGAPSATVAPDAATQHICDVLGMSYADYVKWSKIQ